MSAATGPESGGVDAARRMFAADVASNALGIEVLELGTGTARLRMRVTETMVNGYGIAHGGYLFLLADTAFACACNTHGEMTVASGADVSFVASARRGEELLAVATEQTRYGRNGIYDVTVYRQPGAEPEVVAEFRGRSRTVRR